MSSRVSTVPVREAIRELAAMGILDFAPHKGAWVRELSIKDTIESLQVRSAPTWKGIQSAVFVGPDATAATTFDHQTGGSITLRSGNDIFLQTGARAIASATRAGDSGSTSAITTPCCEGSSVFRVIS